MMAQMAGELFVRDIEVPLTKSIALQAEPEIDSFLGLPFTEAIEHFQSIEVMTPEEFDALSDQERFRSFTMRRAASQAVTENAFRQLQTSLSPGGAGLAAFIASIGEADLNLGVTQSRHGYLETVYRTAVSTSYNAGRLRAQTDPAVVAATGFWQYVTAGDDRVREEHEALDGKQWVMGDDEALLVYPPNGFNCRCIMLAIDEDRVTDEALQRDISAAEATSADEPGATSFAGPPSEEITAEATLG